VAEALGGLPANKMHCSNLAADALHIAIEDYLNRTGRSDEVAAILKSPKKASSSG
jgi:nitrogen fixation NifU-like protein